MEINIGNCLFRLLKSKHETKISKTENLLETIGDWMLYIQQFFCLHIFLLRGKEICNVIVVVAVRQYELYVVQQTDVNTCIYFLNIFIGMLHYISD
jgi:hypothetical protein